MHIYIYTLASPKSVIFTRGRSTIYRYIYILSIYISIFLSFSLSYIYIYLGLPKVCYFHARTLYIHVYIYIYMYIHICIYIYYICIPWPPQSLLFSRADAPSGQRAWHFRVWGHGARCLGNTCHMRRRIHVIWGGGYMPMDFRVWGSNTLATR